MQLCLALTIARSHEMPLCHEHCHRSSSSYCYCQEFVGGLMHRGMNIGFSFTGTKELFPCSELWLAFHINNAFQKKYRLYRKLATTQSSNHDHIIHMLFCHLFCSSSTSPSPASACEQVHHTLLLSLSAPFPSVCCTLWTGLCFISNTVGFRWT